MKELKQYIKENYVQINEDGVYKGASELANYIFRKLKENDYPKKLIINKDELNNIQNIFFDDLYISFNDSERLNESINEGGRNNVAAFYKISYFSEVTNMLRWDTENKRFRFIDIFIFCEDINDFDTGKLVHELNHAHEDYLMRFKDPSKTLDEYLKSIKYKETRIMMDSKNVFKQIVSYIEYLSTKPETRSFVAQAIHNLKNNLHKYKNINDAIVHHENDNEVFSDFLQIKAKFEDMCSGTSARKRLCEEYRELKNIKTNEPDDDKIIKIMNKKLYKYEQSLYKHVNKVIKDYYES